MEATIEQFFRVAGSQATFLTQVFLTDQMDRNFLKRSNKTNLSENLVSLIKALFSKDTANEMGQEISSCDIQNGQHFCVKPKKRDMSKLSSKSLPRIVMQLFLLKSAVLFRIIAHYCSTTLT